MYIIKESDNDMDNYKYVNQAKYHTFSLTAEASEELEYVCKRVDGLKKSAVVSYVINKLANELKKEDRQ